MKVTVVGSYKEALSVRNGDANRNEVWQRFEKACVEIGRALAEDGHRLIVAHSENIETAEALSLKGFRENEKSKYTYEQCFHHEGDAELKAHFDAVEKSDVVILIGGANGTYASGLTALRRRKVMIPIPVFGGSARDLCEISEIEKTLKDPIRNLDFQSPDWSKALTDSIKKVLSAFPRVLIIHGRGDSGDDLKKRIIEKSSPGEELHGVAAPVIMNLSGSGAVAVPNFFEDLASEVSAAIVIVTADDIGGFARIKGDEAVPATELKLEPRARENVWVEVGWFWGRLGRERIFLWVKDKIELPSDLQGVARTDASTLDSAWSSITSFLLTLRGSQTG